MRIDFEQWFKKHTSEINFSKEEHHPFFHYEGASPSCPKCNLSLESPRELYNRLNPVAYSGEKEIKMEVINKNDDIDTSEEKQEEKKEEKDELNKKPEIKNKLFGFLKENNIWSKYIESRKIKKNKIIEKVEESKSLTPSGIENQHVLCLPDVGYTRSLSIIQCLIEIEAKLNKKIHEEFDIISGTGNSSIIAVYCALGEPLEKLKSFWVEEWCKAYQVTFSYNIMRKLDKINPFSKEKFGFSESKAKSILSNFFKVGQDIKIQKKFYDLKTEVYLPALFLRFKESFAYTKSSSENLPLVDALADLCLDPFHFDTKETVKDRGIPYPIKDIELRIMQENKNIKITKIDVPFLHVDQGSLDHATSKELAPAIRDASDFINKINTESHAKNFEVERFKFECNKISDLIPKNSTKVFAINSAIEAGKAIKQRQIEA